MTTVGWCNAHNLIAAAERRPHELVVSVTVEAIDELAGSVSLREETTKPC